MEQGLVYLRALELGDLERTYKWHSDPDLYKTIGGTFRFSSRHSEEDWLRKKAAFSNNELNLAICLVETGEHIGNIYMRNIDWVARSGDLTGIMIGVAEYQKRGYAFNAIYLIIKHAFKDLGLHRLTGFMLADNAASIRLMDKLNFKREGLMRQASFKEGVYRDVYMYSQLANEFFELEEKLNKLPQISG